VLTEVDTGSLDIDRLARLAGGQQASLVRSAGDRGRRELADRAIVNVNSTARGGGVAEMLLPLVAYARGAGIDCRWLVIDGDPEFFRVTKRIHNRLHGVEGDGGALAGEERAGYERTLAKRGSELLARLEPRDVVILHDPQTAGLVPGLADAGNPVIWRCHVGVDDPNELARSAWRFLEPYVERADRVVFSREQFVWDVVDPARRAIIAPSIDALAPKNQDLAEGAAGAILQASRLRSGGNDGATPGFVRLDGSTATVGRRAALDEDAPLGPSDRYVLQVSRWDSLKDPLGVIEGFAEHVAGSTDAHLVYAGPDVGAVSDDPEGAGVLRAARDRRLELPEGVRARVHLALLPMDDLQENAAIVNALQACAAVVVQKSLAEGFGLTVAEAMWKARPVVASRIGGIGDQIDHGHSGLLLDDPSDLAEYGAAVRALLGSPARAASLGAAARDRVRERFLGTHSLLDYLDLIVPLLGGGEAVA
jgi:trehalose synthase